MHHAARRNALYGWLLLLPAAVLLAAFTHLPALGALWHSLHSSPKPGRAARFVGLEHYRALLDDPVFATALVNNAWYALGTIVATVALALGMALWANQRIVGRGWLRLAYFTPTVLPMIAGLPVMTGVPNVQPVGAVGSSGSVTVHEVPVGKGPTVIHEPAATLTVWSAAPQL